jgi:hypothetical protein
MSTQTQYVVNRQDPAIEAYRLGLLGDVQEFIKGQIERGDAPPDYQVAGLSPGEQASITAAQTGVGAYQPFLTQGSSTVDQGATLVGDQAAGYMGDASTALKGGIGALAGTGAMYDPNSYQSFMNPYEDQVIDNTMADIRRQGDIAQQGVKAQAVGSGAFGGSRGQIAQSELDRNVMKQQADTAAQMRASGFQNAQQAAMNAFESGMGRQQQLGQLTGQIGAGLGSLGAQTGALGQQLGGLGIQQAGIGEMGTNLNTQDIQNLMTTGATERGVNQAGLDALRLTNLQRYTQPYQQYGFLSDIYSGTPTGSSTLTAASAPQVSPFQTAMGLGISGLAAASGAQRAGLF